MRFGCHASERDASDFSYQELTGAEPLAILSSLGMAQEVSTGTLIGERYRLEHQVGQGGMGAVWVAEDEKLHRWVAVKLLGPACAKSRSARERFEREAMALARLRSTNVVQVFDYGTSSHGASRLMSNAAA